jgi:hypothetical protein
MAASGHNQQIQIALLSVAGATGEGLLDGTVQTWVSTGGKTLLEGQMTSLVRVGINHFLIEVDNVPGVLLTLADKFRESGCAVDFVRTGNDVRRLLPADANLLVHAEAHYFAEHILSEVVGYQKPVIATLDGRDENAAFERMDLNTRWAGLAVVDSSTVSALSELPQGWSIVSSLLRQAIQDKVALVSLDQQRVQDGRIRLVDSAEAAEQLSQQILSERIGGNEGFIEAAIIGPVAARLAPTLWRSAYGYQIVGSVLMCFAATALILAAIGWNVAAIIAALLAMSFHLVRNVMGGPEHRGIGKWLEPAMWLLLVAAIFVAARNDMRYANDGMFAAFVMIGLTLLAQKLTLPTWASRLLKSPLLVCTAALAITPVAGFTHAIQWIGAGQIAAMIAAKWIWRREGKKPKQA